MCHLDKAHPLNSLEQSLQVSTKIRKGKQGRTDQQTPEWLGMNDFSIPEFDKVPQTLVCVCEGVWAHWNRDRELVGQSWCNWCWSELWGFWRISANSHSPPVCPLFRCLWHSPLSTFRSPQPPFCVWCWEFMRGEWSCESLCVSIVHVYLL